MYRPSYEPPSPSPQPNQRYPPLNRLNLDMIWRTYLIRNNIMWVKGSAHSSTPVEDDSPVVEEVAAPVKAKKVLKRRQKIVPTLNKESSKPWTIEEEVALCQAWCDVSENDITGNAVTSREFWLKVTEYFEKETGSNRGYDSILSKWKNRVRPRISAFCAIFNNVQWRNDSGSCDLIVYQKACVEYATEYDHDFSLELCWQILKDHSAWKQVEMPSFYSKQNASSKKAKTSKTTSCSGQGGLNLNEEANGYGEEVWEVRSIGRDRAKKKTSSSSHSEASSAAGGGIVDIVAGKWKSLKSV
ncbi:hypothetical protein Tco_1579280, partial [Tanacetum coccineum]